MTQLFQVKFAPGELTQKFEKALTQAQSVVDELAHDSGKGSRSALLRFEKIIADLSDATSPLIFMGYVSTEESIRREGSACEEKLGAFNVSVFTRKDLYAVLKASVLSAQDSHNSPDLRREERLKAETLRDFVMNGLELPDDKLSQMRELRKKLASLEAQFAANVNQDATAVEFTHEELKGCSDSFLERLKKAPSGKLIVTAQQPDYFEVMKSAENAETRRKMSLAYNNQAAPQNVKILEEAISLRQQIAKVMGFSSWAEYRLKEGRMASNPETVMSFLNGLKEKLAIRNKADLDQLLALKKKMDPKATELHVWDLSYYSYQIKKEKYALDDDKIREYFPAETVVQSMFDIYSTLLGVQFVELKEMQPWASEVKIYQIFDQDDKSLLSYFCTDFFPRPGKYGHAAAFPLITGRKLEDGQYSKPVASIVSNFTPPSDGKPSLLTHSEVRTLFHEFGHIMHQTLTRAPYASLSGTSVPQDFVEAPSQMLENWIFSKEILDQISGHYQDPSKKLPEELQKKIVEARDFNQGYNYTRQLMLALLDMNYHTSVTQVDTTQVLNQVFRDIIGIEPQEGTHFQASFGHLMGGYDSGYYGYLWSEVYSDDLFTRFEKEGLLNSKTGRDYRRSILEKGNIQESMSLLVEFLGRKPNSEAFFKRLKLSV